MAKQFPVLPIHDELSSEQRALIHEAVGTLIQVAAELGDRPNMRDVVGQLERVSETLQFLIQVR